jgi:hypothetical protein
MEFNPTGCGESALLAPKDVVGVDADGGDGQGSSPDLAR